MITNRCADACAESFAIPDRGLARDWLTERIIRHGVVTAELPGPLASRRSPSGYFLVVDAVLVLPLAADREGLSQWIATSCLAHPQHLAGLRPMPEGMPRLVGWGGGLRSAGSRP